MDAGRTRASRGQPRVEPKQRRVGPAAFKHGGTRKNISQSSQSSPVAGTWNTHTRRGKPLEEFCCVSVTRHWTGASDHEISQHVPGTGTIRTVARIKKGLPNSAGSRPGMPRYKSCLMTTPSAHATRVGALETPQREWMRRRETAGGFIHD